MTSDMTGTLPDGSTEQWRDKKRYLWLIGLVIPSAVFIIYIGWALTGWSVWLWSGPLLILVIVPLIDLATGVDTSNPPDEVIEQLENDRYYRWITYWFLPIQYFGFFAVMGWIGGHNPGVWITKLLGIHDNLVASGVTTRLTQEIPLDTIDKIALAISIGCVAGIGINTAHELGHKKESVERWLSKIALAQSFYGHFYIEHNRGHHVRVATPEDPASSRMGENFYQFWPRTVAGSLKSAWHLEAKRYARKGKHPFQLGNDVLNAWVMSAVLFGAVTLWLGVGILPYLALNALVGFSLLEVINFVEHYGMLRQKVGEGERERYERVNPSHSWNSNQIATNVLLYHLQRHSDHHANPTRRYQALRDFKESPVLPTGYAGMIVLAIVPAIYRRAMWPLVLAHFDGDLTLANISPRKREKILAKFPPPAAHPEFEHVDTRVDVDPDEVLAARCPGCGYTYEVVVGNELEGFAAGTAWKDIPDDWCCPDCGVREKVDFVPIEKVDAS